jgi:hypothetical protein
MEVLLGQLNVDPRVWLAVGGLLALVGVIKIIGKGLSMALWIVLLVLGVSLADFGLQQGGLIVPQEYSMKIEKIIGPGRAMTEKSLKKFCSDILSEKVGSPAWCQQVKAKPKIDWTSNEAIVYAQMCLFNNQIGNGAY